MYYIANCLILALDLLKVGTSYFTCVHTVQYPHVKQYTVYSIANLGCVIVYIVENCKLYYHTALYIKLYIIIIIIIH